MKIYLYNPSSGAPIKNWYDGSSRWSLEVDEVKAFPSAVADKLCEIYGFLQRVSEQESEQKLAELEAKEPAVVKVAPTGELVPKTEAELVVEKKEIEEKKSVIKKLAAKVKKAPEAEPSNPPYIEWSRGELISEAHKRKVEIKGIGSSRVSKEQIIALLENADKQK